MDPAGSFSKAMTVLHVRTPAGSVTVSLRDAQGRSEQVATLETGGLFGEMFLMPKEKRCVTVTALDEVECAELHKEDAAEIPRARPELAREISAILEQRQEELASDSHKQRSPWIF